MKNLELFKNVILASAIVFILFVMFYSFNNNADKQVVQNINNYYNTTNSNLTTYNLTTYNMNSIMNNATPSKLIRELTETYAKLSFIVHKLFDREYACKKLKPLPNDRTEEDGTWVTCDDVKPTAPCVEYSFGIAGDFRFEDAYRAYTGCEVLTFDPSMKQQDHQHSPGVMFYNSGLSYEKSDSFRGNEYMRQDQVQYWKVDTVEGFMKKFNHPKGNLLKIDIEGAEWDSLIQALNAGTLYKWDQLLFEIHLINYVQNPDAMIEKWYKVFYGLATQNWKLFYSHVNPIGGIMKFPNHFAIPCCYELSFINMNNLPGGK